MKNYVSEGRAAYEDVNHGFFSKKLAQWAISNMKVSSKEGLQAIEPTTLEQLKQILSSNGVQIKQEHLYTAWYLYNMARADYQKSLTNDLARSRFVEETLYDPDGCPQAVLECFTAKMCAGGIPIYWEEFL